MPDAPVLLAPGEGEGTERYTLLSDRDELVLTEFRYAPNQDGPQRHIHRHHSDAFYVLEGELRITLDQEDLVLGPGAFVLIPPSVIHAFGNPSDQPSRYLNFHAPGCGFGDFLRGDNPDFDQNYDVPPGSGRPTSEAVVTQPGEGERLALGPTSRIVKGEGNSLVAHEVMVDPGFEGPVAHVHDATTDAIRVLDGTLTVHIGDETTQAGPGTFVLIPPGVPHTFSNPGSEPVRLLNILAPGGFEGYFHEVAAAGRTIDAAEGSQIASKYDFRAI